MSKSKLKMIILIFLLINISFVSVGYAVLNSELTISGEAHVRVLDLIRITDLKVISKENAGYETYNNKYSKNTTSMFITLPNTNSSIIYEVTVKNASSEKYQIKNIIEEINTNQNIKYEIIGLNKKEAINENSVIKFQIKFTTTLSNQKGEYILKYDFQKYEKPYNKNIIRAYVYDEKNSSTKCITGEENTCKETYCYKNDTKDSCPIGTIIQYMVNDNLERFLYVLHDDGKTITAQQRMNTVYNIAWYNEDDNTKGPLTILPALEEATKDWTNVNTQIYTMGTTNFNNTNSYTGCSSYYNCTVNTYTLDQRIAKARMITLQEATEVGCSENLKSCPIWMYNYLYDSISYGGTVNDRFNNINSGYMTMTANSSNSANAWRIGFGGRENNYGASSTDCGARAVVVINK